jgi:porphobilinogen synthase
MNKPSRIAASHRLELTHRPRRNRKAEWARRLVAEHALTRNQFRPAAEKPFENRNFVF